MITTVLLTEKYNFIGFALFNLNDESTFALFLSKPTVHHYFWEYILYKAQLSIILNVYWAPNHYIKMITEGSCDTEEMHLCVSFSDVRLQNPKW